MIHDEITLADKNDAWHFVPGIPLVLGDDMRVRRATRWDRLCSWAGGLAHDATRWFRPRTVCAAVDVEAGAITLATERWSWRRWRWERG